MAKKGGVQSGSYVFGSFEGRWLCTDDVDAGNINIYQGCHACIFIVDPRKVIAVGVADV